MSDTDEDPIERHRRLNREKQRRWRERHQAKRAAYDAEHGGPPTANPLRRAGLDQELAGLP